MGYGWDFCPRMIHQGIWRPVTLGAPPEVFPDVRLRDGLGTVEIGGEVVLRVESPQLWWPNGIGEQHLYDVEGFRVGFREVTFDGYELVVNGVRVPVRGWNWVPIDALYAG
jgi:beta-mannosidase